MSVQSADAEDLLGGLEDNKYVTFSLGPELYGTRLLDVREVVETLQIKPVPNTIPAFRGVCNLRGQIVGVIDLRQRFAVAAPAAERPILLVFETDSGAIAASVDRIGAVTEIPAADIETKPNIVAPVSTRYILGIAKVRKELVTLLDLRSILSHAELEAVESSKMQAKTA